MFFLSLPSKLIRPWENITLFGNSSELATTRVPNHINFCFYEFCLNHGSREKWSQNKKTISFPFKEKVLYAFFFLFKITYILNLFYFVRQITFCIRVCWCIVTGLHYIPNFSCKYSKQMLILSLYGLFVTVKLSFIRQQKKTILNREYLFSNWTGVCMYVCTYTEKERNTCVKYNKKSQFIQIISSFRDCIMINKR